jgi:hypothetical protein
VSAVNSGGDIYPKQFQPAPGRFSVLVSTGDAVPAAARASETEPSAQPAASASPEASKPDAFSGAESTPSP